MSEDVGNGNGWVTVRDAIAAYPPSMGRYIKRIIEERRIPVSKPGGGSGPGSGRVFVRITDIEQYLAAGIQNPVVTQPGARSLK